MAGDIPRILPLLVIGDDARLLAEISSRLAIRGRYLPLLDGPRIHRPDLDAELIRRNNAAFRLRPRQIILAGLPDDTCDALNLHLPRGRTRRVDSADDLTFGRSNRIPPLIWGRANLGLGLLHALRSKRPLAFHDNADCPREAVPTTSGHLVVCEDDNDLAQVIAANYAFSIGAGMCLIPSIAKEQAEAILERFYTAHQNRTASSTTLLGELKNELRRLAGGDSSSSRRDGNFCYTTDSLGLRVSRDSIDALIQLSGLRHFDRQWCER